MKRRASLTCLWWIIQRNSAMVKEMLQACWRWCPTCSICDNLSQIFRKWVQVQLTHTHTHTHTHTKKCTYTNTLHLTLSKQHLRELCYHRDRGMSILMNSAWWVKSKYWLTGRIQDLSSKRLLLAICIRHYYCLRLNIIICYYYYYYLIIITWTTKPVIRVHLFKLKLYYYMYYNVLYCIILYYYLKAE